MECEERIGIIHIDGTHSMRDAEVNNSNNAPVFISISQRQCQRIFGDFPLTIFCKPDTKCQQLTFSLNFVDFI